MNDNLLYIYLIYIKCLNCVLFISLVVWNGKGEVFIGFFE